jgi:hypothetical protein
LPKRTTRLPRFFIKALRRYTVQLIVMLLIALLPLFARAAQPEADPQ